MKFLLGLVMLFSLQATAKSIHLTHKNSVLLRGEVSQESVTSVQDELEKLVRQRGKASYPIYLVINSPGGSVIDGENLIQYLKTLENVHTISFFAASMGSAIVEGNPGKRYATEHANIMFHRAAASLSGNLEVMMERLKWLISLVERLEKRTAKRVGLSLAEYKKKAADEWWMTGKDAAKQNVVDEVVDITCSKQLIDDKVEKEYMTFFGPVSIKYSRCPLFDTAL